VPFYFPSTIENAVGFYRDIAERFPKLGIMLFHNPALHNVKLAVPAFEELVKQPNIIGMKDSHRDTLEFMKLKEIIDGKISVFCNTMQFHPFHELGAEGFWSIDSWMGPEPLVALYNAVISGNTELAKQIYFDISPVMTDAKPNYSRRETAAKIAIRYAGYCDPGPLRPPFVEIPKTVDTAMKARAERWQNLRAKYRGRQLSLQRSSR
jgi:trans-o-hydroxybenzylidenepyruvate hydratase-aldolase